MGRIRIQEAGKAGNGDRPVADFARHLERGQARHEDILLHRHKAREGHVHGLNHVLQLLLGVHAVADDGELGHPGRVRDAQIFGNRRADLRGIAVGSLLAAEDQVKIAHGLNGLGERVAGGQHVCAAQTAIGKDIALVRAHHIRLAHDGLRLRRAHRAHNHLAANRLAQTERSFQRVQIVRVHFALDAVALEYAGLFIHLHLVGGRHLLDAYEDIHDNLSFSGMIHQETKHVIVHIVQ